ncbi:hypothetical protein [Saccharopolyspora sp. NPDC049357]|uniref:hypothetical protein n=1 Tax=Saccharopolyspora sp. NPDC049357 TaxID=3154507 RepID=UPI003443F339
MPIGDQAGDPASALSGFLRARLPHRGYVEDGWAESLNVTPSPEYGSFERWDDVGRALELRIGLDLGRRPEPAGLLTYLPPQRYSDLLQSVGFEPERAQRLPSADSSEPALWEWKRATSPKPVGRQDEDRALATCLDLMEVEQLAHRHPGWGIDQRRRWFAMVTDDASLGSDPQARHALDKVWAQYVELGRAAFHHLGSHVCVAPVLGQGFGVADFVVDNTLVDIKLTREPSPPVGRWLRQLLGYLLLDWDDVHRLEVLAVYAGWQGQMLTCSVVDLLAAATSAPTPTLTSLRDEFRTVMRRDVEKFVKHKHR